MTSEQDVTQRSKALRVQYGLERLYGKDYKPMKKRICYVVLTKKGEIIAIKYFICCKKSKCVFALAQLFTLDSDCFFLSQSGHHILRVNEVDSTVYLSLRFRKNCFLYQFHRV